MTGCSAALSCAAAPSCTSQHRSVAHESQLFLTAGLRTFVPSLCDSGSLSAFPPLWAAFATVDSDFPRRKPGPKAPARSRSLQRRPSYAGPAPRMAPVHESRPWTGFYSSVRTCIIKGEVHLHSCRASYEDFARFEARSEACAFRLGGCACTRAGVEGAVAGAEITSGVASPGAAYSGCSGC